MKKWKKRLLVLAAALTMCLLTGTLVPAANSDSLPLDGVERQFAKLGTTEDEPAQVGAAQLNVVKVGYDSISDAKAFIVTPAVCSSLLVPKMRMFSEKSLRMGNVVAPALMPMF